MAQAETTESVWDGFYIGASVGTGDATGNFTIDSDTVGVQAGYLKSYNSLVFGGELEYSRSNLDQPQTNFEHLIGKLTAGYAVSDQVLPYAVIGASSTNLSQFGISRSDNTIIYGAGMRVLFSPNIFGTAEYLVKHKDNFAGTGADLTEKTFSIGVSYKF